MRASTTRCGRVTCAVTSTALQDHDSSRYLYEQLLPYERRVGAAYALITGAPARQLRCLATVLSHYDEAERHFRVALEIHEHIRAPYWIACKQLDFAEMMARRQAPGDEVRALELGASARRIAASRGYGGLLSRTEAAR